MARINEKEQEQERILSKCQHDNTGKHNDIRSKGGVGVEDLILLLRSKLGKVLNEVHSLVARMCGFLNIHGKQAA